MSIGSLVASRLARSGHSLPAAAAAAISQAPASPLLSGFGAVTRAFSSRSQWKGAFLGAFLQRTKNNRENLNGRKIWSRRSSLLLEFVCSFVLIYNGKTHVREHVHLVISGFFMETTLVFLLTQQKYS